MDCLLRFGKRLTLHVFVNQGDEAEVSQVPIELGACVAASAAIVGTTTSPQFRESPETAKVQVVVVGCNVPPDCAGGVAVRLLLLRYERATEATTMPTSKDEPTITTSLVFLDL